MTKVQNSAYTGRVETSPWAKGIAGEFPCDSHCTEGIITELQGNYSGSPVWKRDGQRDIRVCEKTV